MLMTLQKVACLQNKKGAEASSGPRALLANRYDTRDLLVRHCHEVADLATSDQQQRGTGPITLLHGRIEVS